MVLGFVWYGWFDLVSLVWYVRFGLVNEDDLKSTFKSSKSQSRTASWNYSGWGQVGLAGSNSDYKAQFNRNCNCLLELSLAILVSALNYLIASNLYIKWG